MAKGVRCHFDSSTTKSGSFGIARASFELYCGVGGVGGVGGMARSLNINVTGGGGAAASSSASGAGAAGGGQGAGRQAPSIIVVGKGKGRKRQSGITAAKRRYTDKRKVKLGEMRALKSKRLREFNTKTKQMPKAERDKRRREFKAKVNAQYKEVSKRFPPARGLKDLKTVRDLIARIERVRMAS